MAGELRLEDCVSATCPWSGKPISADPLALYGGKVAGSCTTGRRDKREAATSAFDGAFKG